MDGVSKWVMYLGLILSPYWAAAEPQWRAQEKIPSEGRPNPYYLSEMEWSQAQQRGQRHALYYPVTATGLLFPYYPIKKVVEAESDQALKKWLSKFLAAVTPFDSMDEMEEWLGLTPYPKSTSSNEPFSLPPQDPNWPHHRMGLTFVSTAQGVGFTVSCAQCHSSQLFGKSILGMSNRFPRANDFFEKGMRTAPLVSSRMFQWAGEATDGETQMFEEVKATLKFIGAKKPIQLGLDTSLAQVALSLAKRSPDEFATRMEPVRRRRSLLDHHRADSKPAVWWNLKYKNRWLSDGSVVSGNPILTNIIWNEIGRGADLTEISAWIKANPEIIKELTTAVFSTEAPHWTDFFPAATIDELQARKGEGHFKKACAKCHGHYEKNWSRPDAHLLTPADRLKNWTVTYHEKTPVIDVGTDPGRHQGIKALTGLNDLAISKENGIKVIPQKGYVPPPLIGIWARWPYFHNNSSPSLCAVLTRGTLRPKGYWARPAKDPNEDFDSKCNGYPQARPHQAKREMHYNSRKPGLSRWGHDERIILKEGREIFTAEEKQELILFLQTL